MVPRQHEKISDLVRHHGTEFRLNRFSLGKRDDNVIDMRVNGLERGAHGRAVERVDHVEKAQQF